MLPVQAYEADVVRRERLPDFTAQALANILWAFAALRYYPAAMLPRVAAELHARLPALVEPVRVPAHWLLLDCMHALVLRAAPVSDALLWFLRLVCVRPWLLTRGHAAGLQDSSRGNTVGGDQ
jgi:hypothetical protein